MVLMTYQDLINEFHKMYIDGWGYVGSTAGILWTQEKQDKSNNPNTKKWIGHIVADCSGAVVYALKRYGISVYHGSNRIARVYTKELLDISKAKPGMIAFKQRKIGTEGYRLPVDYKAGGKYYNGDLNDYYHCGIIDNDMNVINLQSVTTGCVKSKITNNWSKCGELLNVDYGTDNTSNNTIEIPYDLAKELYSYLKGCFNEK